MAGKKVLGGSLLGLIGMVVLGLVVLPVIAQEGSSPEQVALTGTVSSAEEGLMEGVLVSAKQVGSTMTTTVVSNAEGVYSFPRDRLVPGEYAVSIRAVGYVPVGSSLTTSVDVAEDAVAQLDLELQESNILELAHQLTDPEWFISYPLDEETIFTDLRNCTRCHTQQRPAMSTYNEEQLGWVMKKMVYHSGSTPMIYQLPPAQAADWGRTEWGEPSPAQLAQAATVAAINLSDGMWDYELQTLPRPTGKETEVIYTTWDLPVTARPHDTRIGLDGFIYFNHFNDNAIGRLDPETGEVQEWRWPYLAEEGSFRATGSRTMMGPDEENRFYIHNFNHGDYSVIFDPATEEFTIAEGPGGGSQIEVAGMHVDGYAYKTGPGGTLHRIDFSADPVEFTTIEGPQSLSAYDIAADTQNNIYGAGRSSTYVWYLNAETLDVSYYDIPEEPRGIGGLGGGMRRGITDAQDRLWWGSTDGNYVGVLDPRLPEGEEITLYPVPWPWFMPYDAHHDDAGYTWTGGQYADRVARLNLESGEWSFYLLPFQANIRDVDLHPAEEGGLSGLWIGHAHQGLITLVEPLSP